MLPTPSPSHSERMTIRKPTKRRLDQEGGGHRQSPEGANCSQNYGFRRAPWRIKWWIVAETEDGLRKSPLIHIIGPWAADSWGQLRKHLAGDPKRRRLVRDLIAIQGGFLVKCCH
jgi:hypothetical protein